MKRCAVALFVSACLACCCSSAQQTSSPANSHVKDNASLGNEKSSKKEKAPTTRTVTGQVTDESGQVLQGALVTLTDKSNNERTSFFTKKDGHYQFEDLSFTRDYEVQALYKSFSSEARKVSQFDALPRPVRILEINTHTPPTTAANQTKQ